MRSLAIFISIFIFYSAIHPQQMDVWHNYTSKKNVRQAVVTGEGVFAISEGGAFLYKFSDETYLEIDKAMGLSSNNLTSIAIDKYGKIWLGSQEGTIDVYDTEKQKFVKRILEISNSNRTAKQVNELRAEGDTIYASTDFGLSLIDTRTFFFYDTFMKFGSITSQTKIKGSCRPNLLYVASESGIAKQKAGTTNLLAPESWENYSTNTGLPSNNIIKIINYNDSVIALTDKGLSIFREPVWSSFLPSITSNIIDAEIYNGNLIILTDNIIYSYSNNILTQLNPGVSYSSLSGLSVLNEKLFASSSTGIIDLNQPSIGYYYPAGPNSIIFSGISVDKEGNIWAGSGTSSNLGFYKFDGSKWTNYDHSNIPNASLSTFIKVYTAPDNTVYFMNWGDGFTRLKNGNFKVFNSTNTELDGISENHDFIVVQGLASDSKGNLWVLTYRSNNKNVLNVLKPESTWEYFSNPLSNEILQGYDLLVDQYNTKWMIIGKDGSSAGEQLYYYNADRSLHGDEVNGWGRIAVDHGLNSYVVNAIAIDRRGELWVGTSQGINIIYNTQKPKNQIISLDALSSQVINCIAVDPIDQKWVGTQQGVFLLSSDGSKILQSYNTTNSPLPTDIVKSISIDNNSGIVYFGTDFGMASLTTPYKTPNESFTDLTTSPNPVYLGKGENVNIKIGGLIRESEIKILTISGKLINTLEASSTASPGSYYAFWNGKDFDGKFVNSGIYIIVAYDKEGNSVATFKVAVITR